MRQVIVLVLAWYFALASGPGVGRVVGPFFDKVSCHAVWEIYFRDVPKKTACWSDQASIEGAGR